MDNPFDFQGDEKQDLVQLRGNIMVGHANVVLVTRGDQSLFLGHHKCTTTRESILSDIWN